MKIDLWKDKIHYYYLKYSNRFNKEYYLRTYPDVKKAGVDPIWHYIKYGKKSGRLSNYLSEHHKSIEDFIDYWRSTPVTKSVSETNLSDIWEYYSSKNERIHDAFNILKSKIDLDKEPKKTDFAIYLFYGELLLINRQYQNCIELCKNLTKISARDLRLNDLLSRASLLNDDASPLLHNRTYGYNPFQEFYCPEPFEKLVLDSNLKMACCCAHWMNSTFGSFKENGFNELWHSDTAKKIRGSVTSGAFEYCDKISCPKIRYKELPKRDSMPDKYNARESGISPIRITMSQDSTCNLTCPSCRTGKLSTDKDVLKNVEDNIFPFLLQGEISDLNIAGFGDPFASPHYRSLLSKIDPDVHRIDKMHILTNGLMLDNWMWDKFKHLENLPFLGIGLSIDAASEETYRKLRREGDWNQLKNNLKFISKLRKENRINHLTFAFVIQVENFLEMPAFIKMSIGFDADHIRLIYLHQGGELRDNHIYQTSAIHLPSHPRHHEYIKVLEDPVFKNKKIYFM